MALDKAIFDTITPSRFITFTISNPNPSLSHQLIRVAVLDSPIQLTTGLPRVAAMFVPQNRETDWIFSTESGHLELLLSSPHFSRLILIGNQPSIINCPDSPPVFHRCPIDNSFEQSLKPLVIALSPNTWFKDGNFEIPILRYEDDVVCGVVLEKSVGSFVGEMLVEDVEFVSTTSKREFRRRLRFKRMPNLVQTLIRIVPEVGFELVCVKIGEVKFRPDVGVLVHGYLVPMVASLAMISGYLEERTRVGRPKALCVGVGGGALLGFLKTLLGFQVVGVEVDEEVLRIARQYFGWEDDEFIQVVVGDAIKVLKNLACRGSDWEWGDFGVNGVENDGCVVGSKFDVIMVDLDAGDLRNGISAPPLEFVRKDVLIAAKMVLCDFGVFVINVIPPSRSFYDMLICDFKEVFHELYEIDVENGESFVLIATVSDMVSSLGNHEDTFIMKLRMVISGAYVDSIRKI
ncbi:hypothetical protein CFOL_v3_20272 [Cephalotus follicularis]|uniref:Methyltransferase-like protein 13 n=1 Tax=Cephalotus follicularis TaxID=3775 RepID=A0A1Q3C9A9_CEPFO|nr:hypothetical protein CFOL_v3_20272 [Cephalotus follicularis]